MSIEIKTKETFEVRCRGCGESLSARMGGDYSWSDDVIVVEPCKECLKDAADEVRSELEGEQQ